MLTLRARPPFTSPAAAEPARRRLASAEPIPAAAAAIPPATNRPNWCGSPFRLAGSAERSVYLRVFPIRHEALYSAMRFVAIAERIWASLFFSRRSAFRIHNTLEILLASRYDKGQMHRTLRGFDGLRTTALSCSLRKAINASSLLARL